jgi:hypothetical protein
MSAARMGISRHRTPYAGLKSRRTPPDLSNESTGCGSREGAGSSGAVTAG